MYTPTQNYGLAMPSYGDEADIGVINDMVTVKVDELLFQNRTISAPPFETTEAYTEGDLVVYENVLYRFTANKAAGAWDSSKVVQTSLAAEIESKGSGGASSLSDLTDTDIDTPVVGEVLTWNGDDWVNAEGTPSVTKTATGNPIEFSDGADAPLVKCTTTIQGYQEGSGTPSPENVRPIVAYTEGEIVERGVNHGDVAFEQGAISANPGRDYAGNKVESSTRIRSANLIPLDTTKTYTISVKSGYDHVIQAFNDNGIMYSIEGVSNVWRSGSYSFSGIPKIAVAIKNSDNVSDISPLDFPDTELMIYAEGETPITHTTTYPSAIYRGSEDVVNGTATKRWGVVVFDGSEDESWTRYGSGSAGAYAMQIDIADIKQAVITSSDKIVLANFLETITTDSTWANYDAFISRATANTTRIVCGIRSITTPADWKTYLSSHNLVIAYELATPTTSSVTPTNLPIKSLSGYNYIESSTGDMEVEYITEGYQPLVDLIQESQHVYSTQEQIVGKWVDGSDLYERTFELSNPSQSGDISTGQTYDIAFVVSGYYMLNDGNSILSANQFLNASNYTYVHVEKDGDIKYNITGYTATKLSVTIRYTKTSSNNRSLSKGATEALKAEISGIKDEGEELTETDEKAVKKAQSEGTETKEEADETEGNADEMQDETVTE